MEGEFPAYEGVRRLSAKYYTIYVRPVHLQIWYSRGSSLPQMLMDSRRGVHAYFRILEHVGSITDNFHFRIWSWPTLSDTSMQRKMSSGFFSNVWALLRAVLLTFHLVY